MVIRKAALGYSLLAFGVNGRIWMQVDALVLI